MVSIEFSDVVKSYAADGEALGVDEGGTVDGLAVATAADLAAHEGDTANPHSVTAAQVGLGNVDNTSDADKPVSTATAAALDGKQPLDADLTTLATLGVVSDPSTGRLAIGGVEIGGTGPIDVSASLLNGWALGSGGSLVLSRSKNVVMLEGSNLVRAAATSNQFLTVLSGFRPASATASFTVWDTYQISGTIVERGHVLVVGTARLDSAGSSAATKYFTASWVTNDAWPASI